MMILAGVDEAGRGPLAGPVIAAAVILDVARPIHGLCDSKQLSAKKREYLSALIQERALACAIGRAEVSEIDTINILQATLLAMKRAVEGLSVKPGKVLVDGLHCPAIALPTEAVVKGDESVIAISAASILAKVHRDQEMIALDAQYPQYGFAQHKGYGTKAHIKALNTFGVTPIHRRSFAPVKNLL